MKERTTLNNDDILINCGQTGRATESVEILSFD